MGATNIGGFKVTKGTDLTKWYRAAVDGATREYGQDQYNGTISTTRGIKTSSQVFKDRDAAEDYIWENTEKWGPVLAVTVKTATEEYWLVGGWAAE